MKAVDCEALAGSWDLGSVREGFEIIHRATLTGGFGDVVIEANRDVLGDFPIEVGDVSDWTPQKDVSFLFGTPPCSGWSLMNTSKSANARGPDSAIQRCTWSLIEYASKCWGSDGQLGPEIVSFECVQQAHTQGRDLMSAYLRMLRDNTGQDYKLTHVLMSGASIGAAQLRNRFFWVAHRVPFGVDVVSPRRAATYRDAIGDLVGLPLQRELQPVREAPTAWVQVHEMRRPDDRVDWHMQVADRERAKETNLELILRVMDYAEWKPGKYLRQVIEDDQANGHQIPDEPFSKFGRGWGGPIRVEWDKPGRVIHGGGAGQFIHPEEDRFLTMRELSRLMGYPDSWEWPDVGNRWNVSMWLGKNAPVQSAQWMSHHVRQALKGTSSRLRGIPDEERDGESVINVTHAFKDPARISALVA